MQAVHDGTGKSRLKALVHPFHTRFARSLKHMMNKVPRAAPPHRHRTASGAALCGERA